MLWVAFLEALQSLRMHKFCVPLCSNSMLSFNVIVVTSIIIKKKPPLFPNMGGHVTSTGGSIITDDANGCQLLCVMFKLVGLHTVAQDNVIN